MPLGLNLWNNRAVVDLREGLEIRDVASRKVERVVPAPPVNGGRALISDSAIVQVGRTMSSVNLATGALEWERPLVDEMQDRIGERSDSLAVRMETGSLQGVFIAFHAQSTFACSTADGSILWHTPRSASPYAWPTVHAGRVYTMALHRLRAIDEVTGALIYEVEHPELEDKVFREKTGTVARNRIAIAHESGVVATFDLMSGALMWRHEARIPLWRTAEADGRLDTSRPGTARCLCSTSPFGPSDASSRLNARST